MEGVYRYGVSINVTSAGEGCIAVGCPTVRIGSCDAPIPDKNSTTKSIVSISMVS